MTTVTEIASAADAVVKSLERIEPTVMTVVGMFVPGAAPIVALVQPWAPMALSYLDRALQDVASGNGNDIMSAFIEVLQHISKGQPNSPTLTGPTADPSVQGSG